MNRSRQHLSAALRSPLWAALLSCTTCVTVMAQDRPSEADLFGAPAPRPPTKPAAEPRQVPGSVPPSAAGDATTPAEAEHVPTAAAASTPAATTPATEPGNADARDDSVLGRDGSTPMFSEEPPPEDPLTIGGQLYLRLQSSAQQGARVDKYSLNMPTLLDVFFDARPNDRVRGFILGRMSYDPLLPASSSGGGTTTVGDPLAAGSTSGSASLSSLFAQPSNAPRVLLDQFWLRFDISHLLFVTVGRQHVRWGTARFWTPTDFLHLRRRNPLDVFDARTGTTMVKLHLPIESKSWNFYTYGVTEGQDGVPGLTNVAGAARAEFVLGETELGLGIFAKPHTRAKFAADLSTGLGDFDIYGELALVDARASDRVRYDANATLPTGATAIQQVIDAIYPVYQERGYRPQAVGGLTYSVKYHDNDVFTVGAEYFYNGFGYANTESYPGLVLPHTANLTNPATFFYLGQHYGALFATFPSPFKLDLHTFTLSTLGNLSDRSFISRLDYSFVLLTHLRFDAFFSVHYGQVGEFKFGLQPPPAFAGFAAAAGFKNFPPTLFDLGIALRMAI